MWERLHYTSHERGIPTRADPRAVRDRGGDGGAVSAAPRRGAPLSGRRRALLRADGAFGGGHRPRSTRGVPAALLPDGSPAPGTADVVPAIPDVRDHARAHT